MTYSYRTAGWLLLGIGLLGAGIAGYVFYLAPPQPPGVPPSRDAAVTEAVAAARQAVVAQPRSAAAWGGLGKVLLANDFAEPALVCFAQAEQYDEKDFRWPYLQAVILKHGDPEAALEKLRQANQRGPREPWLRLQLADLLLALGHLDEAEQFYRQVIQQQAQHPDALLGLARIAYLRGELDSGLHYLNQVWFAGQGNRAALLLLAEIQHRQGNREAAVAALEQARRRPDDAPRGDPIMREVNTHLAGLKRLITQAEAQVARGQLDSAIALLQQAVQEYPDEVRAHLGLGKAYALRANHQVDATGRQRDFEAGTQALLRAEQAAPDNAQVQFYLGLIYRDQGRLTQAVPYYRRAAALQPGDSLTHYYLGLTLRELGQPAEAVPAFRAAVQVRPDYAEAHVELGDLFVRLGCPHLALPHYVQALQLRAADENLPLRVALLGWAIAQHLGLRAD